MPKGTRAKRAPENETKEARFKRVAAYRLQSCLGDIEVLSNCADKNTYEYTEDQRDKVITHLQDAITNLKDAFEAGGKNRGGKIEL